MAIVNRTMFPLQNAFSTITKMQTRMDQLQVQFGTGKKAATLADMGSTRSLSLSLRSRISSIEGYQASQQTVNLRLTVLNKAVERLDAVESQQRTMVSPGNYGQGDINLATAKTTSSARLDEVLTLLNSEVNGRYLMGGNKTDANPVATFSAIMDGEAGKAGFKQVAAERLMADLGTDGRGRLTLSSAANTVTLAEDGTHPFGLKLSTLSSTSASVSSTGPGGGPPPQVSVQFTGQPLAGETVTVGFTLPDGTTEAITLKAVTGTPGAGEFQVGADPNATAENFSAALGSSLSTLGASKLSAASAYAAAENFFNGSGEPVLRVAGPPYATATATTAATSADTVMWYTGQDGPGAARQTVQFKADDATTVSYGVQANERGPVELVRSLAVFSIQDFPSGDANAHARFDALASRQIDRLSEAKNGEPGSIEQISAGLTMAQVTINNTKERQDAYKVQLETMLSDTEGVDTESVAMEILALKTRLEASYAAASAVSQLSFVNYMPR